MNIIQLITKLIRPISPIRPIRPIGPIGLIRPIGLIGLTLLTSCSGDDTPDLPTPPPAAESIISFNSALSEPESETRATRAPLSDNAQTFRVWAFKNDAYTAPDYTSYQTVMPGYTVNYVANTANTTTSNTNDWEYVEQAPDQTIKYWDFDAKAYRFFGATNWGGTDNGTYESYKTYGAYTTNSANEPNGAYKITANVDATHHAQAPYFSELWFSTGNPAVYPARQFGQPVTLRFLQPFARVRFMFTFADNVTATHADLGHIRFYPNTGTIPTQGNVTVTYPLKGSDTTGTWATSNTTGISAFLIDYYDEDNSVTPADTDPTTWPNSPQYWYYVLPTDAQSSYTAEVSVVTDEVKSAVIAAEYMTWRAGYDYTYKFKITETGGITIDVIQVAIHQWIVDPNITNSASHTVYNW